MRVPESKRSAHVHSIEDYVLDPGSDNSESCPLCKGASRRGFRRHRYWIDDCLMCGHRFAAITPENDHIKRVYANTYFSGTGIGYHDYVSEKGLMIRRGRKYARILSEHMTPGSVFDVGAAAGFVLKGFEEMGWSGAGIEPNPQMAEYARGQMDLAVETGTLEGLRLSVQYDVISLIQVVAHFVSPRTALQAASAITKPSGYWLVETWDKDSITARIFGKSWHEYSPPSVLHWFSPQTLRELVSQFGFREITGGRTFRWIRPSHAASIGRNELNQTAVGALISAAASLIPDRIALPYIADDLFWVLYQAPA